MGYTTDFSGQFAITPRLEPHHAAYLRAFSETRRMKRDVSQIALVPDRLRVAVGLPVGVEGAYSVLSALSGVVDHNTPPAGQPGLWCSWEPASDGAGIQWNGVDPFYDYDAWLQYLIDHFLKPWGYTVEGVVTYQGEDPADFGTLRVDDGDTVVKRPGKQVY